MDLPRILYNGFLPQAVVPFEEEAQKLHQWCEEHYLRLNVKETKELLMSLQKDDLDSILQPTLGGVGAMLCPSEYL